MHEYPLDDVHRLIDGLDSLLSNLRGDGPERLRVDELPELIETIHELDGWRNTTYLQTKVGINGSLLNQFMKLRGTIARHDAIKIADRLRSYLRAQDQASSRFVDEIVARPAPTVSEPPRRAAHPAVIKAEGWITIAATSENKMRIAAISSILDTIIEQIEHANAPPDEQILTQIERQQLIAILETALNVLKSPMVEKGLLKKASSVLKKGAESAAEKQVQQGLGKLMESAAARIAEVIGSIFS